MGIKSLFGFGQARDKPVRNYSNGEYTFNFGRSTSGKSVNEMTAMQTTAVYACVRILSEAIASLPIHVYRYKDGGKEMVCDHPLYTLLHDEPNPEMISFVFRETLMSHLLIWGNAYAQIIRNGKGVPHFTNQLRRRQNAAKQGDTVADGLVEPLMRSSHDAFGQRRRNSAANRPANIEAQRAVHAVRQHNRVTRHQLRDDFPHVKKRFDFAQGDALPDAASDFAGGCRFRRILQGKKQIVLHEVGGNQPIHIIHRRIA